MWLEAYWLVKSVYKVLLECYENTDEFSCVQEISQAIKSKDYERAVNYLKQNFIGNEEWLTGLQQLLINLISNLVVSRKNKYFGWACEVLSLQMSHLISDWHGMLLKDLICFLK